MHFLDDFSKSIRISNFMRIRQLRAHLFHANGQTDVTNLILAFTIFQTDLNIVLATAWCCVISFSYQKIINDLYKRNQSFLTSAKKTRLSNRQCWLKRMLVYTKYVNFPCPPLETALSILNLRVFFKQKNSFWEGIIT